jgi:hypothetical protein
MNQTLQPLRRPPELVNGRRPRSRIVHTGLCLSASLPLPRLYASNRRDGSRLLSSALVIAGIGLVRFDHPLGRLVALVAGALSLYWWQCYRHLER